MTDFNCTIRPASPTNPARHPYTHNAGSGAPSANMTHGDAHSNVDVWVDVTIIGNQTRAGIAVQAIRREGDKSSLPIHFHAPEPCFVGAANLTDSYVTIVFSEQQFGTALGRLQFNVAEIPSLTKGDCKPAVFKNISHEYEMLADYALYQAGKVLQELHEEHGVEGFANIVASTPKAQSLGGGRFTHIVDEANLTRQQLQAKNTCFAAVYDA